jgi:capsular exopolysaccharide synthesis family protein
MSHIFDALQRAETERSGIELDACDLPAELLQIAESAAKVRPMVSGLEELPEITLPLAELGSDRLGSGRLRSDKRRDAAAPAIDLQSFTSLPVVLNAYNKLVTVSQKEGLAAEKFRFLAVRLRHLQQRRQLKQLLITSSMPEEGKSTIAANLACTLATRRQQKVLLIEGDLRRPGLQSQFGLSRIAGLTEYLQGTVDVNLPIYRLDALGIWFLPAGSSAENPLELMQSGRLSLLFEKLKTVFDWIVIDSPPVLPLADTSVWTRLADGILLVTRQGTTDKDYLKRGLEALDSSKLLGALVNSSANAAHNDYYQRYGQPSAPAESNATLE